MRRRLYYTFKQYLPWRARLAVRRILALRKQKSVGAIWPVNPLIASPPAGWPGWPDGKKFAFVITHDVERLDGVVKTKHLAEIDSAHGFRSSFNFIPEGDYQVPPDLRAWLVERGFEVGVHDLHHDGGLYRSRKVFRDNARRINGYIREWRAMGFRSGFMLHQLEWLHDLDIVYDASTFDTDPFEPQPDASNTIFPFWIPAPSGQPGRGYVEMPYTLPQDSTLFLILNELSPDIWLRKLDWLAEHGGMALINVHPDYVCMDGEQLSRRTFPVAHYRQLLEHVRQHHGASCWHPLPGELAAWFKSTHAAWLQSQPSQSEAGESPVISPPNLARLRGKRAAVVLYSYFPSDPRPYRAAEAMIQAGMEVDLLCLTNDLNEPPKALVDGVRVFRLRLRHTRGSKLLYFFNYGSFFAAAFWFFIRRGLARRYDIVHVHNMPDFLVFAALIPKLLGARVILDLHDPMPELMMTIYGLKPEARGVRWLAALERWSIRAADLVLTPNIAFKRLFDTRSGHPEKICVIMNSPDETVFDPHRFAPGQNEQDTPGEFRLMHHGLIAYQHGIDLLVEAVAQVRPKIPAIRLDIYGAPTPFSATALETAERLGVAEVVHYHGEKTQLEIADAIRRCHLGVVPNRRSAFTEINFPTRLFEYLAMRRPVLAPSTQGIRDYFSPDQLLMFNPDNPSDLAAKILWAWENPQALELLVDQGNQSYRRHVWSGEKRVFLEKLAELA